MDVMYRIISITIAIVIFTIAVVVWLWNRDPYYLIEWWNRRIKYECDKQDLSTLNGIPSYHDAWNCDNKSARELHHLIRVNHDEILAEVQEALQYYNGSPMNELDEVQGQFLRDEDRWRPIWIRFMGEWAGSADLIPTLKRITSLFPDVTILHVSIFYPGATLIEHRGPSRAVYRYHYGLKIPKGDVGLKIAGFDVKWEEKEGFIWDDTLSHSAWNHTTEPRIVIFADVLRELSSINSIGSGMMYSILQNTKHVGNIKSKLKQEGVVTD